MLLFVPKVLVALLILAFGAYFARFVGNAVTAYCRNVHLQDAELLGKLAQYAILTFVVLIALDQVNIGGDIVRQTFLIVLAGVVFALALAFGLGGKEWAAELLERWWPRKRRHETDTLDAVRRRSARRRRRALSPVGARRAARSIWSSTDETKPMKREPAMAGSSCVEREARAGHALPVPHRRQAAGARSGLALPAAGRRRPERGDRSARVRVAGRRLAAAGRGTRR